MNDTLIRAIEQYGTENQTIKAIEEMSELTKELAKALLGQADMSKICEEIADVEIMIEQMRFIYDTDICSDVDIYKKRKIERLGENLDL